MANAHSETDARIETAEHLILRFKRLVEALDAIVQDVGGFQIDDGALFFAQLLAHAEVQAMERLRINVR